MFHVEQSPNVSRGTKPQCFTWNKAPMFHVEQSPNVSRGTKQKPAAHAAGAAFKAVSSIFVRIFSGIEQAFFLPF